MDDDNWTIAHGDSHTIEEKRAARRDVDIPETWERQVSSYLDAEVTGWLKKCWRAGLVDLSIIDGGAFVMMTHAQAAVSDDERDALLEASEA
jgi:hypothetical protein